MKKLISIALAAAMLAAVSVPAFAANPITKNTEQSGTTIIKTSTKTGPDSPEDDAVKYTVTIPADTEIYWGTEETNLVYSVESHLKRGQALKVTVAGTGSMKTDAAKGEVYTLPYTLSGDTAFKASSPVIYGSKEAPAVDKNLKVTINSEDWNKAVVDVYDDTLTFTAEV
ncbi:MAG: hypothetical protein MR019_03825 [Ruminococcus sp.]|nr:hypothetical protein [Ruminococcus sp.]MDY3895783.1 hypothetical protein [Candidatus Fimenecus sp.]